MFNNQHIAICNFCGIWYSQSFRNCSINIFLNTIFVCAACLFSLKECLKPSFLTSLRVKFRTINTCLNLILYISILLLNTNQFCLDEIVLKFSGDIKKNQGPKPLFVPAILTVFLYIYYISLLRAYISTHKFDVICISETYLDSDTSDDDDNLKIAGYNLIRADHPSNTKQSGICIYYKHSLAFRLLNIH